MTTSLIEAAPSAPASPVDPRNRVVVGLDDDPVSVEALRFAAGEAAVAITAQVVQGADSAALCAAAHGGALLVLGARHHNRLLGSVSQACVNHPPCPVVIFPTTEVTP